MCISIGQHEAKKITLCYTNEETESYSDISCFFSVRRIPLREPLLLLFVGHVEVALLLVEGTDTLHIVVAQSEVERLDVLADVGWVR